MIPYQLCLPFPDGEIEPISTGKSAEPVQTGTPGGYA